MMINGWPNGNAQVPVAEMARKIQDTGAIAMLVVDNGQWDISALTKLLLATF